MEKIVNLEDTDIKKLRDENLGQKREYPKSEDGCYVHEPAFDMYLYGDATE